MTRTFFTFCLLSLTAAILAAENPSIHGAVLDPSARPVEGARISCASQTVYSSAEGIFVLTGTETCDATIEKAGFHAQSVKLSSNEASRITLSIEGPSESVIVSATRTQVTAEQAGVAATVYTSDDLRARDDPPVPDILRETPGLQIASYGRLGALTQVYTRGAQRTGTLVLLDGVPLNDPGGELHLEHLSSAGIDRIEAVRGPESALFGAEASAGVIQLFTRRGDAENRVPHGSLTYERGNFQTDRWIASLSGGSGARLDYALTAEQLHTVGKFQDDFYRNTTGSANVGYRISESTQVRGVFRMYDAHVGTPGQVAYGIFDLPANEETRNSTLSVRLDDARGSNFFQRFAFGYNHLSDRFNDDEPFSEQPLAALVRTVPGPLPRIYFVRLLNPSAPLPPPNQLPPGVQAVSTSAFFGPFGSLNLTDRKTADYQGTLTHRNGVLVFGYEYQRQEGTISDLDVNRDHHGGFVNAQHQFGNRIFLSGGARVESSSAFGTEFTPRGAASFLLLGEHGTLSSTFLRFSAGRGITEPSLYENFVQSPFALGNPRLRPEKTNSYEAGIVQEWFGRRVRTEVNLFRSSFRDLIAFVGNSWLNVDESWARGIESSVEARPFRHVMIRADYTRLYTRITKSTSPHDPVTGIGRELIHRARNSGAVSASFTPRKWSFIAGGRFVGERQDADFNFGVNRNPGYQDVFMSASYQATRHLAPVLRVENLLDAHYEEVLGYTALSRSVVGGLRVSW
jgi:vitamin B12 transporter